MSEMMICPQIEKCESAKFCEHAKPHAKIAPCSEIRSACRIFCIPYEPAEQLYVCDHAHQCKLPKDRTGGTLYCERVALRKSAGAPQYCSYVKTEVEDIPYSYPPKEAPMEYTLLKPISIKALHEAGACERELHRFAFLIMKVFPHNGIYLYGRNLKIGNVIYAAQQCEGGIAWLIEKGFIKEKPIPLKVGDKVSTTDGSWAYWVNDGRLTPARESGYLLGHGQDSPLEIIAICEGLPTNLKSVRVEDHESVGMNNLMLRGQSGNIYFSRMAYVKRGA